MKTLDRFRNYRRGFCDKDSKNAFQVFVKARDFQELENKVASEILTELDA
uniref:Uncharacterized protein n=1 Tax=Nelumbo nucifera TaxID=4432 RepID=A0A822Y811_NELNU|nr:TPA_asm: hypothetical protein HUJ06_030035 [Nelumbo nucifera]